MEAGDTLQTIIKHALALKRNRRRFPSKLIYISMESFLTSSTPTSYKPLAHCE